LRQLRPPEQGYCIRHRDFSVAAVVLMPPTLIAAIYGMNFKNIPELEWPYGYSMALVLMVTVAALPYLFFKWKRWL
jgi:magnesium transporter